MAGADRYRREPPTVTMKEKAADQVRLGTKAFAEASPSRHVIALPYRRTIDLGARPGPDRA